MRALFKERASAIGSEPLVFLFVIMDGIRSAHCSPKNSNYIDGFRSASGHVPMS